MLLVQQDIQGQKYNVFKWSQSHGFGDILIFIPVASFLRKLKADKIRRDSTNFILMTRIPQNRSERLVQRD